MEGLALSEIRTLLGAIEEKNNPNSEVLGVATTVAGLGSKAFKVIRMDLETLAMISDLGAQWIWEETVTAQDSLIKDSEEDLAMKKHLAAKDMVVEESTGKGKIFKTTLIISD